MFTTEDTENTERKEVIETKSSKRRKELHRRTIS